MLTTIQSGLHGDLFSVPVDIQNGWYRVASLPVNLTKPHKGVVNSTLHQYPVAIIPHTQNVVLFITLAGKQRVENIDRVPKSSNMMLPVQ